MPLPAACTAWAESPQKAIGFQPLETHSYVVNAIWQRVEGTFTFEVAWTNNTDLVAVGLSTDVTFVLGGHDITDDLPRQGLVQKYQPYELETLPPRATDGTGEVSFHTPPNPLLAEANGRRTLVEAESTVAGWCIPAATPDP